MNRHEDTLKLLAGDTLRQTLLWSFDRVRLPVAERYFEALGRRIILLQSHCSFRGPCTGPSVRLELLRASNMSPEPRSGVGVVPCTEHQTGVLNDVDSWRPAMSLLCTAAVLSNTALTSRMDVSPNVSLKDPLYWIVHYIPYLQTAAAVCM